MSRGSKRPDRRPVLQLTKPLLRRCRFVPRHDDELELEVDDPLLVEVQSEDYWYEGYNMRSGARGIFPAYYAVEVTKDAETSKGADSATRTKAPSANAHVTVYYRCDKCSLRCSEEQRVDGRIPAEVPGLGSSAVPQRQRRSVRSDAEGPPSMSCTLVC